MNAKTDRILLVDDNDMQRKLVKTRLERAGFEVEAVAGADDALTQARASHPTLIVSDVLMPGIDGFELCRQVKSDASLAEIPVLLMSGLCSFRANHELAKRVGAAAFLERTPNFENELASVRLCMSRLRSEDPELVHQRDDTVDVEQDAELARVQKLDEFGRLTSGTAHDLNNLLTVILCSAQIVLDELPAGDPLRADAETILAAVARATVLTHQLRAAASVYAPGSESLVVLEDYPQIRRALSRADDGEHDTGNGA